MRYSNVEVRDLVKAWFAISLAFAIAFLGLSFDYRFLFGILVSAFTVGIGFLLHELAHKYFAQKYRCWAEFRANNFMLLLAVVFSFFGFVFAAPGGVFIRGKVNAKKNGIISLAGPVTNIILGLLFMLIMIATIEPIRKIAYYGMYINFWLALFNMIPFFPFDGSKVFRWNKTVYGVAVAVALVLVFVAGSFGIKVAA